MLIGGFQKTSLIDFPKKIAAIVFTQGCNFRCHYCHNPELVTECNKIADEKLILDFLDTRKGKLDGVVITGGEPSLQKDLTDFIFKVKEKGFEVKLDTNGSNPDVIVDLTEKNLLDYIAMDIKAPLSKYQDIVDCAVDVLQIKDSVDFIKNCGVDYEFRTTTVKPLLAVSDFDEIGNIIKNSKRYFLQNFVLSKILDKNFIEAEPFAENETSSAVEILKKYNIGEIKTR